MMKNVQHQPKVYPKDQGKNKNEISRGNVRVLWGPGFAAAEQQYH